MNFYQSYDMTATSNTWLAIGFLFILAFSTEAKPAAKPFEIEGIYLSPMGSVGMLYFYSFDNPSE